MGHPDAQAVESLDRALDVLLAEELRPGTLILTMGAGDVTSLANRLAAHLDADAAHPDARAGRPDAEAGRSGAPVPVRADEGRR